MFYTKSFFCKVSRRGMPYPIVNPLGTIHYISEISIPSLYWCSGYELPRISKSRRHLLYYFFLATTLNYRMEAETDAVGNKKSPRAGSYQSTEIHVNGAFIWFVLTCASCSVHESRASTTQLASASSFLCLPILNTQKLWALKWVTTAEPKAPLPP